MKNIYLSIIFILSCVCQVDAAVERRTAIDVGSGATKVAIADVDIDTNVIIEVIFENSYPVPYQASLDKSEDGTFDQETMELGLKTFKQIKEISDQYQVDRIVAIATSAFRKANNCKSFTKQIKNHAEIEVQTIPQRDEGEIAFHSAIASGDFDRNEVVVWDIGTGSLQITTANSADSLSIYMGEHMGSVAFKNYIISVIQDFDVDEVDSPNPISEADLKKADAYTRAFARKTYPIIKQKIQNNSPVLGIGRLFYHSIRPIAGEGNIITRNGLRKYIEYALNKTDEELNNPFAKLDVSNCILTLSIMKALHIHEIIALETTTSRGLLVSPNYWQ